MSNQHATGVCLDDAVVMEDDAVDEVDDDEEEEGEGRIRCN